MEYALEQEKLANEAKKQKKEEKKAKKEVKEEAKEDAPAEGGSGLGTQLRFILDSATI